MDQAYTAHIGYASLTLNTSKDKSTFVIKSIPKSKNI